MRSDRVVEGLHVGEYISLSTGSGRVVLEVDQLALEAAEEIFCHGVVVRSALAEHTLLDSIGLQPILESGCGVLDAPVAVKAEYLGNTKPHTR